MLVTKGRVSMVLPVSAWRWDLLGLGLLEITIDGDIGISAAQLDLCGDPGRLIVANAQIKGAGWLTRRPQPLLQWENSPELIDTRRTLMFLKNVG